MSIRENMVEPVRRRAEAKQETREALIAAALAEFAEHGIDAPSLDAICARAGYTRGAFYVHFRDRADLLVAVVEHAMTAFIDTVIASGGAGHDLERTIARFADAAGARIGGRDSAEAPTLPLPSSVPFARVLEGIMRDPRLRSGFTTLLTGAIARLADVTRQDQGEGVVRADVDPAQVGGILALVALGVMVALDVGLPLAPDGLRDTVLRLLAPSTGSGS
jgi:AcrR family transcriptional regulator